MIDGWVLGEVVVVVGDGKKMRERAAARVVLPEDVGPARPRRRGGGCCWWGKPLGVVIVVSSGVWEA